MLAGAYLVVAGVPPTGAPPPTYAAGGAHPLRPRVRVLAQVRVTGVQLQPEGDRGVFTAITFVIAVELEHVQQGPICANDS